MDPSKWVRAQSLEAVDCAVLMARTRTWFAEETARHIEHGDRASTLHALGERIVTLLRLAPFGVRPSVHEPPLTLNGWKTFVENLLSEATDTELCVELYEINPEEAELRQCAMHHIAEWITGDFMFLAALGLK